MEIQNKQNLNEAIVRAVKREWYSGAGEKRDYSVTGILNPPKVFHLMKRHEHEIVQDVSDRLWLLMGSAMHAILERANESDAEFTILTRTRNFFEHLRENPNMTQGQIMDAYSKMVFGEPETSEHILALFQNMLSDRYIIEKRFKYTTKSGKIISGGIDLYDRELKCLEDYKFTSIYTWIYRNRAGNTRVQDWTEQLNMYRLFLENAGIEVNKLKINLLFRDFSKSKAKFDRNYPLQTESLELELFGLDIVEMMIEKKIANLEQYNNVSDDNIPVCTPEERWEGATQYAVMKEGRKTAIKLHYSSYEAKQQAGQLGAKHYVETRPATPTRCIDYCACNKFCNFYKSLMEKEEGEKLNNLGIKNKDFDTMLNEVQKASFPEEQSEIDEV